VAKHGGGRRSHPWERYIRDVSTRSEKHGGGSAVLGECARTWFVRCRRFPGMNSWKSCMSYVRYETSWRLILLPCNHDPCLTDLDPKHHVPAITFRYRQRKPYRREVSAYEVISRPQELHCTLLRINPTSLMKCIPIAWSLNKIARKSLFALPQYPSESSR